MTRFSTCPGHGCGFGEIVVEQRVSYTFPSRVLEDRNQELLHRGEEVVHHAQRGARLLCDLPGRGRVDSFARNHSHTGGDELRSTNLRERSSHESPPARQAEKERATAPGITAATGRLSVHQFKELQHRAFPDKTGEFTTISLCRPVSAKGDRGFAIVCPELLRRRSRSSAGRVRVTDARRPAEHRCH